MTGKVLITGATGFVGYHLIKQALSTGLQVFAAVRESSDVSHLGEFEISYIDLDYSSVEALKKDLETHQFEYIIHAAGITKAKSEAAYNKVNAEYSKNLGLAVSSVNYHVKKFVFVSSLAALGPLHDLSTQLSDDANPRPVTSYGRSKLLAEKYLSSIEKLPLIIIRPTAVYGPREKDILILFKTLNRGLEPHIGQFQQRLTFVYVVDLARIIVEALFSEVSGKAYNVSDGRVYDRYALAECIKSGLNKNAFKFHLPVAVVGLLASVMEMLYRNSKNTPTLNKEKMAELTAVNWACSIERIQKDLNYHPQYDLEDGVIASVQWYKENNWI